MLDCSSNVGLGTAREISSASWISCAAVTNPACFKSLNRRPHGNLECLRATDLDSPVDQLPAYAPLDEVGIDTRGEQFVRLPLVFLSRERRSSSCEEPRRLPRLRRTPRTTRSCPAGP